MSAEPAIVCRHFFDALEARDGERIRSLIAPDAVLSRNGGPEVPLAILSNRKILASMERSMGRHRYEDVRQIVQGHRVAEQHRIRSTAPDGTEIDADVCVVVTVDDGGLIARVDEYSDLHLPSSSESAHDLR
ncbi:nuclear transport factor 2 family protein [Nocardia sp. NBC_00508]|uniref:nuclear transport factor 2 family protein n=1 Tax=Nocardia sp. NBC_00508 TaxID=2975992 RepID=UPI002E81DF20|nr:nuclear transport factor 2 family protein [Nocardia sp. NBC_00508]WUD67090.1 nuclear transport factor 2 family protein [Nocardia sp. NBC_00508]